MSIASGVGVAGFARTDAVRAWVVNPRVRDRGGIIILASLAITLLNASKPICIDDAAYYQFARHIAAHPLDPYGFEHDWHQWPIPATHVLAPPVLPYWWAASIVLLGDDPILAKLWLFPFVLTFVAALESLLRRFSPGWETPTLTMTAFAPVVLPGINVMLDIPALGLALASFATLLLALDRRSTPLAGLAGLMAGVAMETKYTILLFPALFMIRGLIPEKRRRRRRQSSRGHPLFLACFATATALTVFAVTECLIASKYGESHFLLNQRIVGRYSRWSMLTPFLSDAGAASPMLLPLALIGMGARRGWVVVAAIAAASPFAIMIVDPLQSVAYFAVGLAWLLAVGACAQRLAVRRTTIARPFRRDPDAWLLIAWAALECVYYLVVTPFPAARRLLGLTIVATLLVGRRTSRAPRRSFARAWIWPLAIANGALGLYVFAIDDLDATAEMGAVAQTSAIIASVEKDARVWYLGQWGIQYYGNRAGWRPARPDASELKPGDWLVTPGGAVPSKPEVVLPVESLSFAFVVRMDDAIPFATVPSYYCGATPLERRLQPRVSLNVWRVRQPAIARTLIGTAEEWAWKGEPTLSQQAVPALLYYLESPVVRERVRAIASLVAVGSATEATERALVDRLKTDNVSEVRRLAATALGRFGARIPAAEVALREAMSDADPSVAKSARDAWQTARAQPRRPLRR